MDYDRRRLLTAVVGVTGLTAGSRVLATAEEAEAAIFAIAGDAEVTAGPLKLTIPKIAENGLSVPVSVSIDSAMIGDSYVESVAIFADENPIPEVIKFNFTENSGEAFAATRMRLAATQNVVAVAKLSDGTIFIRKQYVHVTIGGCGI